MSEQQIDELDSELISGLEIFPPRMTLHGEEKIGKSTFAASAPDPVFIQTEPGLNQIGPKRFPLATTFAMVVQQIERVLTAKHNRQTLVIDTVDWLERLIVAQILAETGAKTLSKAYGGFGVGQDKATSMMRWLVTEKLSKIWMARKMGIIFVCHTKTERVEVGGQPAYQRSSPRLHKDICSILTDWCDVIGFVDMNINFDDDGERKVVTTGGNKRKLVVRKDLPSCLAGNRYGITKDLPLNWADFAEAAFARKV